VRQRLSGEERRMQIIAVASRLFAEKGFSGTRTREIAELAGTSEALIFQHFKTKEALYRAVLQELLSHHPFIPEVQKKIAAKNDLEVLRTIALHIVKNVRQDFRMTRLALFSALEGVRLRESQETGPTLSEFLGQYIEQRIEDGAFKKVNPQIAARLFLDAIAFYMADQKVSLLGPPLPFSEEETIETLVNIFLGGLKKP
jgi:TetR/AcrR family transcriptional regulator